MTTIASQITSRTVDCSTVYSDADQIKHQSSASLAFVWGIHRDRWIPRTNGQLRGKCFHLMTSSWYMSLGWTIVHGSWTVMPWADLWPVLLVHRHFTWLQLYFRLIDPLYILCEAILGPKWLHWFCAILGIWQGAHLVLRSTPLYAAPNKCYGISLHTYDPFMLSRDNEKMSISLYDHTLNSASDQLLYSYLWMDEFRTAH